MAMDRRQRKTRQAIFAAFEELVERERYSAITVAQIIELADVGRSTFYEHFETKDELLRSMCTEMFDHIFAGVDARCSTHSGLKASDLQGRLAHLLYHLRDTYGSICGKLLEEGEPIFTSYFSGKLAELFERDIPPAPEGMPRDLEVGMLVSAFCRVIVWWFANGASCEPERVTAWFMGFLAPRPAAGAQAGSAPAGSVARSAGEAETL